MRGAFIKKHETRRSPTDQRKVFAPMRTDGSFHGLFTLAQLPTAWGSMRRRRNGSTRIFRMRRVVWENVTRWACLVCEKSVEIREICGRQLSAQCAKEQAECIYSPTDRDKHRYHAGCLSITQIAPSAQRIDTDFSQAENLSMRARFSGHAPRGQKFIAQRQAKRRPGYNVPWSLRSVSSKVLKHSVLCLLLPLQGVV